MSYTLEINNFQSIKHAKLDFSGFTVICGKSDLGKSALRRATETALFNDWKKEYIRKDTNKTEITFTAPALTIKCTKSKTDNSFTINDKHIGKIGKDAPELPAKYKQELNISTQFEPMFMVAYKDTENTKILNRLFSIDLLEHAQYLCGLDLRRAKQDHQRTQELLTSKQNELKATKEATETLKALTTRAEYIYNAKTATELYNQVKNNIDTTQHKLNTLQAPLDTTPLENYLTLHTYFSIRKRGAEAKRQLQAQPQIDTTPLENYLTLSSYMNILTKGKETKQKLQQGIDFSAVEKTEQLIKYLYVINERDLQERIEAKNGEIANVESELAQFKQCPTCGQVIV